MEAKKDKVTRSELRHKEKEKALKNLLHNALYQIFYGNRPRILSAGYVT